MDLTTSMASAIKEHRGPLRLTRMAVLAWCVGCSGSDGSRQGDVFFKGKKGNDSTTVDASVGAALLRASQFPTASSTGVARASLRLSCKETALDGVPPSAALRAESIPGQTTPAYIVNGGGRAPIAIASIGGSNPHVEVWELDSNDKLKFVRKRTVRLSPDQASWAGFLLAGVACLPENRVLLGVVYYAPQVTEALFLYDLEHDSYVKIGIVAPDPDNLDKLFEAQVVAPEAAMVLYATGRTRTGPEVYYNSFNHLRLFDARHPDGLNILNLAAADGTVERWQVVDKTLWLQATDKRDARHPTQFVWSLDLGKSLP